MRDIRYSRTAHNRSLPDFYQYGRRIRNSQITNTIGAQMLKQLALKPQDLLVALKLCVSGEPLNYNRLAVQLSISASETHSAARRAYACHLLTPDSGSYAPNKTSLREFLLHGIKYTFPVAIGSLTRGMPTGVSASPLKEYFEHSQALPIVWPDPNGNVRGIAITPLYPSVPAACKNDEKFYRLLSVVDALRGGAAREREIAKTCLESVLQ